MKKLVIYDVDDTLFVGNQLIGMEVDGEFRWLTQQEFHEHDVAGTVNETIDLSRLRCSNDWIGCIKPNQEVIDQAIIDIRSGHDVLIMTARNTMNDVELFKHGFRIHSINIDDCELVFAGDHGEQHWPSHVKKSVIFDQLFRKQYDRIVIYDDNVKNLEAIHHVGLDYPFTDIESYHVQPDGSISRYIGSE